MKIKRYNQTMDRFLLAASLLANGKGKEGGEQMLAALGEPEFTEDLADMEKILSKAHRRFGTKADLSNGAMQNDDLEDDDDGLLALDVIDDDLIEAGTDDELVVEEASTKKKAKAKKPKRELNRGKTTASTAPSKKPASADAVRKSVLASLS